MGIEPITTAWEAEYEGVPDTPLIFGADDGNRTHNRSLGSFYFATKLRPQTGIKPVKKYTIRLSGCKGAGGKLIRAIAEYGCACYPLVFIGEFYAFFTPIAPRG